MFDYMSYSQIAALFLGIAFTVISIATTFLAVKYAKKFKSFIKTIFFSLTAPFVASVGWLFLIFSFLPGLRNDDLLNLIISILALFICAMVITVAKALYNKHADLEEKDEEETAEQEEPAEQAVVEDEELATEQTTEQARIEDKKTPLLLAHTPENEDEIVVDETAEVEEPAEEESEEESVETKETEEEVPETEEVEENPEETVEEVEEPAEEEPAEETAQEETPDDNDDEDPTEDEEFEKFLEELRKKVEENPDGDDENK